MFPNIHKWHGQQQQFHPSNEIPVLGSACPGFGDVHLLMNYLDIRSEAGQTFRGEICLLAVENSLNKPPV